LFALAAGETAVAAVVLVLELLQEALVGLGWAGERLFVVEAGETAAKVAAEAVVVLVLVKRVEGQLMVLVIVQGAER
jgi:hypothetical protein